MSDVKVKPLEWKGSNYADTPFGEYTIDRDEDDDVAATPYCCWSPAKDGTNLGHFASEREAQAAAQADYNPRIRSQIIGSPGAETGEREQMARDWCDFCAAIGVPVDTHEAVAAEINNRSEQGDAVAWRSPINPHGIPGFRYAKTEAELIADGHHDRQPLYTKVPTP